MKFVKSFKFDLNQKDKSKKKYDIQAIAYSSDGLFIAFSNEEFSICVYDINTSDLISHILLVLQ